MAILTAKEARSRADASLRTIETSHVVKFKAAIEDSIKAAVERRLHMAQLDAPEELSDTTLDQIRVSLGKLGYRAKVEHKYGFMARELLVAPKRVLKLFWVLALVVFAYNQPSYGIEMDKYAHAGAGYICQDLVYNVIYKPEQKPHRVGILPPDTLGPKLMAAATCFMFGLAKEVVDSGNCQARTGHYCGLDGGDLMADGIGIATKSILQISFDF